MTETTMPEPEPKDGVFDTGVFRKEGDDPLVDEPLDDEAKGKR